MHHDSASQGRLITNCLISRVPELAQALQYLAHFPQGCKEDHLIEGCRSRAASQTPFPEAI